MAATDAFKLAKLAAIIADGVVLSLHSADPGTTGANEITGGSYARKTFAWSTPVMAGGLATAAGATQQMNVPAGVAITHYGIRTTGGTFLYGKALNPGATLNANGVIDVTPTHTYGDPV
ncbi:hypothetical protein SEA_XIMENITA_30 [Mycobacterium phage Ximenita]|uniref:Minor tail protein n=1 Tax=Mycobacterium phage Ximenita TaxID=2708633 RepID=A0A6G6XRX3_9CAUD|nr:hypothetical protein I5G82_gp077 [Mycobacterium phage Ximenita]QIG61540.1 hypothetical protein SEA_XIMENITA_30 [Mycobacterium phage Ximenita]